ncbi:MAG: alpha-amylase family glycosyl hydrolase, partial [Planctomycetota bacterium]
SFASVTERAIGLTGTTYRPTRLTAGETYFWRVRARAPGLTSPFSLAKQLSTAASVPALAPRPVIYQLVVRHFGNTTGQNLTDGDKNDNGCGRFEDVDGVAIERLRDMGVTHIWLTGVLEQATLTDHSPAGPPADDPDIVKGRAGSFYAIKDYFDVSPDYAADPARRLAEFDALVDEIHQAGLKVLIDLVPNHVARSYKSDALPVGEPDLGAQDDQSTFFARDNAFFYLQADPGRGLTLTAPLSWNPAGLDRAFAPEDGGALRTPKVTGDNQASYAPPETSWYETVKLNYGHNFADPSSSDFGTPGDRPATWLRIRNVLRYWIDRGVDGFRCDFAHFVPDEAWQFLIDDARAHAAQSGREVLFLAEAYDRLRGLLGVGFDAVYDDGSYDGLKRIYQGSGTVADLDAHLQTFGDAERNQWARYLENHDERRIASPIVAGGSPDDSGFGSMEAGRKLAPLQYLVGSGPILLYNGQEVGEDGAGREGYGGDDGRTSIFDYWRLPALSAWVNEHRFDGGGLTVEQRSLRAYYRRILTLANHPYARGSRFWGLHDQSPGLGPDATAFARFATDGGGLLVVVTNFGLTPLNTQVVIPLRVGDAGNAALPQTVTLRRVLDPSGGDAPLSEQTTRAQLASGGFSVGLPAGGSAVYLID